MRAPIVHTKFVSARRTCRNQKYDEIPHVSTRKIGFLFDGTTAAPPPRSTFSLTPLENTSSSSSSSLPPWTACSQCSLSSSPSSAPDFIKFIQQFKIKSKVVCGVLCNANIHRVPNKNQTNQSNRKKKGKAKRNNRASRLMNRRKMREETWSE